MSFTTLAATARTALLAVLTSLAVLVPLVITHPASSATPTPGLAEVMVSHIDAARTDAGLPSLGWDPDLGSIAEGWSSVMAANGTLAHNPAAAAQHQADWSRFAENVGMARDPGALPAAVVQRLHDAFMQSAGHRANLLNDRMTALGVGIVLADDGRVWVTVNLADSVPPPPDPQPRQALAVEAPHHYHRGIRHP